jgi:hypothetical protein
MVCFKGATGATGATYTPANTVHVLYYSPSSSLNSLHIRLSRRLKVIWSNPCGKIRLSVARVLRFGHDELIIFTRKIYPPNNQSSLRYRELFDHVTIDAYIRMPINIILQSIHSQYPLSESESAHTAHNYNCLQPQPCIEVTIFRIHSSTIFMSGMDSPITDGYRRHCQALFCTSTPLQNYSPRST